MTTIIQIGNEDTQITIKSVIYSCEMRVIRHSDYFQIFLYIMQNDNCSVIIKILDSDLLLGTNPIMREIKYLFDPEIIQLYNLLLTNTLQEIYHLDQRMLHSSKIDTRSDSYIIILRYEFIAIPIVLNKIFKKQFTEAIDFVIWRSRIYSTLLVIKKDR